MSNHSIDPSLLHVVFESTCEQERVMHAVGMLAKRMKASARPSVKTTRDSQEILFGGSGIRRFLDPYVFSKNGRSEPHCSMNSHEATFRWTVDGDGWELHLTCTPPLGHYDASNASASAHLVIDRAMTILHAIGKESEARLRRTTGGEAADRIGTVAMLAAVACAQTGEDDMSMRIHDDRVLSAMLPENLHGRGRYADLSAEGLKIMGQLPTTVVVNVQDEASTVDGHPSIIHMFSEYINGEPPEDAMERLRLLKEAEGLPILYRWRRD